MTLAQVGVQSNPRYTANRQTELRGKIRGECDEVKMRRPVAASYGEAVSDLPLLYFALRSEYGQTFFTRIKLEPSRRFLDVSRVVGGTVVAPGTFAVNPHD
jgi:hypothetical protein